MIDYVVLVILGCRETVSVENENEREREALVFSRMVLSSTLTSSLLR